MACEGHQGIKNRMEFFRGAIGHYLAHLGARDTAALFTNAGVTGACSERVALSGVEAARVRP